MRVCTLVQKYQHFKGIAAYIFWTLNMDAGNLSEMIIAVYKATLQ